eukprot:TRINITY_DN986_c0_g1_i4.p1 TRINITY_DN986_c0_g1~~TRINITY_DN986_c0_g1_i4.p1  ORF type:complete len:353 (-),score=53.79 TRINITY_DN986_c0_g1_i4:969-1973(-)
MGEEQVSVVEVLQEVASGSPGVAKSAESDLSAAIQPIPPSAMGEAQVSVSEIDLEAASGSSEVAVSADFAASTAITPILLPSTTDDKHKFLLEVWLTIRHSVWQNRLPTLMAVICGGIFLVSYYLVASARPFYEMIGDLEKQQPILFSFVASTICGGLAPMFTQCLFTGSLPKPFMSNFLFAVFFWSFLGVYVKGQYTLNSWINGEDAKLATVVGKVVCDQFVFSPFVSYIWITLCFRLRDNNFCCAEFKASLTDRRGLLLQYCSMNVANWCTWLPGGFVIYSLPSALQMPCWSVIVFFYSSLLTLVSAASSPQPQGEATKCQQESLGKGDVSL